MWTAQSVKAALPDVEVKIGKKKVQGRLSGRLNAYATLSVTNGQGRGKGASFGSQAPIFMDWKVSWETIAHSLNTGRPIIV